MISASAFLLTSSYPPCPSCGVVDVAVPLRHLPRPAAALLADNLFCVVCAHTWEGSAEDLKAAESAYASDTSGLRATCHACRIGKHEDCSDWCLECPACGFRDWLAECVGVVSKALGIDGIAIIDMTDAAMTVDCMFGNAVRRFAICAHWDPESARHRDAWGGGYVWAVPDSPMATWVGESAPPGAFCAAVLEEFAAQVKPGLPKQAAYLRWMADRLRDQTAEQLDAWSRNSGDWAKANRYPWDEP